MPVSAGADEPLQAEAVAVAQIEGAQVDVVVYGGTPAGIAAAISAARDGRSVLMVEPTRRIGGMITNGLSHTDFHSRESLTGMFLDFAGRVEQHYALEFGADSPQVESTFGGTFGEPKVNLLVLQQMLGEWKSVRVILGQRLVAVQIIDPLKKDSAAVSGQPSQQLTTDLGRIQSITVADETGRQRRLTCRMAIDATYEGDLMAMAGVKWRAGRESRSEYQESLAPEVADQQLQAYNFRFIMTQEPNNRVMPTAPRGYRREDFVGILDVLATGEIRQVFAYPARCIFKAHLPALPNAKYDINDVSRNIVRLSLPGKNLQWPDGSAEQRQAIFEDHLRDQAGLLYFLQNDEQVPEKYRSEARQWGWCRDEFTDSQHLPDQLYVREARRMLGLHVYVQQDSEHAPGDARARLHLDSIAMGDYGNNCHGTDHEGPRFGGNHTGEFYNPVPPYQIPYFAIVPKELDNLLVPTAVSSSHVGFCGLRLEPIWMSLGQAAGHAVALALDRETSVQKLPVRQLQNRLHKNRSATIYVSDVLPGDPDFSAVQWWGTLGGLHGLEPMPDVPGKRGRNLHGQYFAANPGHAAQVDKLLDAKTAQRWRAIAKLAGIPEIKIPTVARETTRGEFITQTYSIASSLGIIQSSMTIPRLNPSALPNSHPPGEVDNLELMEKIVTDASLLPGIVIDDVDAELVGDWQYSTHTPPYVGAGYLHDMKHGKGEKSVRYTPAIVEAGLYELRISHCANARRATNAQISIHHADGHSSVTINQQKTPENGQLFTSIGQFRFAAGRRGWIEISNAGSEGQVVIADAIQLLPVSTKR